MKFNIQVTRVRRRLFTKKTSMQRAIQELEAFQKEWNALYEHSERVKQMLIEMETNKK